MIAACGGTEESTTDRCSRRHHYYRRRHTTTAASASTTTVSAGPEAGREIKIGNPLPMTGVLASFGAYEKWADELSDKTLGDGIVLGDGKMHKISILQTRHAVRLRCGRPRWPGT